MTKKILIDEAVVKQALEALEYHPGNYKLSKAECVKYNAVEATLREALEVNNKGVNALAEQQEYWEEQPDGSRIPVDPSEMQQAAEPATEADMAVYKAIADNYHASLPQAAEQGHFVVVARRTTPSGRHSHTIESDRPLPIGAVLHTHPAAQQAAEPVADIADLINNLEQLAHRKGELWERCQGKLWPQAESDEFTALRDTLIPRARQELAERVTASTHQDGTNGVVALQPLTMAKRYELWVQATIEPCTHEACYQRGISDAEAAHRIASTNQGE